MEELLLQGRNLIMQLDLEVGVPLTATCPEFVEEFVVGDGGGEAAIENHCHCLPDHLHKSYATVFPSHFWYQDHHLQGRFLCDDSVLEI